MHFQNPTATRRSSCVSEKSSFGTASVTGLPRDSKPGGDCAGVLSPQQPWVVDRGPWTVVRGAVWGQDGLTHPRLCRLARQLHPSITIPVGCVAENQLSGAQIPSSTQPPPTWRHSPPAPSHGGKMFTRTGAQRQKPQNRLKSPSRFGRQTRDRPFLTQNPGLVPPEHLLECTSAFSRTPRRGTVPLRCC